MKHNPLIEKILKASQNKYGDVLAESKVINEKDEISTDIPAMNIALSGSIDGGFNPGFLMIAGKSKHFKTMYMLLLAKAYLDKYPESVMILFDSEFGAALEYFESIGIDSNRVTHLPITTVEDLKFQLSNVLETINRGEKVFIAVDSLGNLASNKEIDDAKDGKVVADMTRAKSMKSLSRIFTTQLVLKDVPMVAVNHVYETLEMFSKAVPSGGCVIAGTNVKMASGKTKPIEEIQIGDIVVSHMGEREVNAIWNPETLENGYTDCYSVTFEDGSNIVCSENHRFLSSDGSWKYVDELSVGDDLAKM